MKDQRKPLLSDHEEPAWVVDSYGPLLSKQLAGMMDLPEDCWLIRKIAALEAQVKGEKKKAKDWVSRNESLVEDLIESVGLPDANVPQALEHIRSLRAQLERQKPVSVKERLPTEEDWPDGQIEIWAACYREIWDTDPQYRWLRVNHEELSGWEYTHWRRIDNTPPEPEEG